MVTRLKSADLKATANELLAAHGDISANADKIVNNVLGLSAIISLSGCVSWSITKSERLWNGISESDCDPVHKIETAKAGVRQKSPGGCGISCLHRMAIDR
jgi:hypothetical protein